VSEAKPRHWLEINRAPVLTLWATVVAERLGFDRDEALTLGRAVAGLNAYSNGGSLGLFQPTPEQVRAQRKARQKEEPLRIDLLHRAVPATRTEAGLRALSKERPIKPESVQRYLESKFGAGLQDAQEAMEALAGSMSRDELVRGAYGLYEAFRPKTPPGTKGWGAAGRLGLDGIRRMAGET